jgi:hypothetical protein
MIRVTVNIEALMLIFYSFSCLYSSISLLIENCIMRSLKKFHPSPNTVIKMIKSRMMRWVGHLARMEKTRNTCKFVVGNAVGKG